MAKMKAGGWFYESTRHSLAAQGIPTGRRYNKFTGSLQTTTQGRGVSTGSFKGTTVKSGGSSAPKSGGGGGGGGGGGSNTVTGKVVTAVFGGGSSTPAPAAQPVVVAKEVAKVTSSGALTEAGKKSIEQAKVLAAKGQTGYNAALGGYVKPDGTISFTNDPKWVPASVKSGAAGGGSSAGGSSAGQSGFGKVVSATDTQQGYSVTAGGKLVAGAPSSVTTNGSLDVNKAATYLKTASGPGGSWTNTPENMAIFRQAEAEGKLPALQAALMAGKQQGIVAVTGTGAALSYLPTQITADNPKGIELVMSKWGSPDSMMSRAPNVSTAQGPAYVSPDGKVAYFPRSSKEILSDPTISMVTPNVSSVRNESIMQSMANDATLTYKAMKATQDLARAQGVELSMEDARNAILAQFGITGGMSYTPTQQKFIGMMDQLTTGSAPAGTQVTPMVQQIPLQQLQQQPQYFDLGAGGTLRALFRERYGKPEWTLSDLYRSRYGVGRDIATGLTAEQAAALGATAAGGTVAYGLSSGKRTAGETAQQVAVYAARKRFAPWRR